MLNKIIRNNTLALICARGGSKGLRDKNLLKINGKPLIYFAIDKILKNNLLDLVHDGIAMTSKEREEYANRGALQKAMVDFFIGIDKARVEFRKAQVENIKQFFEHIWDLYDSDHSGFIEANETKFMLEDLTGLKEISDENAKMFLSSIDTDETGKIDKDELTDYIFHGILMTKEQRLQYSKSHKLDDIIDAIEKGGNESGSVDLPDDGIGPRPVPPKPKKKIPDDMEYNWNPTGGSDGRGQWEVRDIPSPKLSTPKSNIPPKPKKKLPDGFNYRWGSKGGSDGKGQWVVRQESFKTNGALLTEAAKLGHFEPEQLNVNIEDLRKGIMPEFPKDPPPEMVDGYNPKSRLAPKKLERSSFIKITKKDLAKNHRLKDSEIKDFMDQINAVNDFIKKHPEELVYAQTRYPKSDPRLAQLNWEMDQKLNASKEYMDKHYPENQKLFTKIQKSIKKNIELTDPKSFKGVKIPKFKGVDLTDFKRRKEVVARHFKKAVRTKKIFSKKKT